MIKHFNLTARMQLLKKFLKKSRKIHGYNYNYKLITAEHWIGDNHNVPIICKLHGQFTQNRVSHSNGSMCIKCAKIKRSNSRRLNTIESHKSRYKKSRILTKERQWIASFNNTDIQLNKFIKLNNVGIYPDGIDYKTKTIYEFWGDFWHGNPDKFNSDEINIVNKKSFGELFKSTQIKRHLILNSEYSLVEIWETDYKKLKIVS